MSSGKQKPLDQVSSELQEFGFRINEKFLVNTFGEGSFCSFDDAYNELIHSDFRKNVGLNPSFGATINTTESGVLEGPVVLQVTSIANIAQPSKRQHEDSTPRLLLIKLNDGHSSASALEFERISDLSTKVAPGTKILLTHSVRIACGKLLLSGNSCRVLGGRVDHLFKAWLTNRSTFSNRKQKKQESSGEGASPPEFELTIDATIVAKSDNKVPVMSNIDSKVLTKSSGYGNAKSDKRPATQGGSAMTATNKKDNNKVNITERRGSKGKPRGTKNDQSSHHSKSKSAAGFSQRDIAPREHAISQPVGSYLPPPPPPPPPASKGQQHTKSNKNKKSNNNYDNDKAHARGIPKVRSEDSTTGKSYQRQKSKPPSGFTLQDPATDTKAESPITVNSSHPPPPPLPMKKQQHNPKSQAKGRSNNTPPGREKDKGASKRTGREKAQPHSVETDHTRTSLHQMQVSSNDATSKQGQSKLTSSAPSFVPSSQPRAVLGTSATGRATGSKNNNDEVRKKSNTNAKSSKKYTFT